MFTNAHVGDARDQAAFVLNLSRTGGDVVPHRRGSAFLVNSPAYAKQVLDADEDEYHRAYHPYRELAPYYRPTGAYLLGLGRDGHGPAMAAEIAAEIAGAGIEMVTAALHRPGEEPVHVDLSARDMTFRALARLLFGVDASEGSAAYVRAESFLEECWANDIREAPDASAGRFAEIYQDALAAQRQMVEGIAAAAGIVPVGEPVPDGIRLAIMRTLTNAYSGLAMAFTWAVHEIAKADAVQAALRAEVDEVVGARMPVPADLSCLVRTRHTVLEVLRLYPPAWALGRTASSATSLGDTQIPAGSVMCVSPYAMHRLGRVWDRPNEFVPERFAGPKSARPPYAFFPFGGGPGRCPAAPMVVGHLQLLLAVLLQRATIEEAAEGSVRRRGLVAMRPDPGVFVRLTARGT